MTGFRLHENRKWQRIALPFLYLLLLLLFLCFSSSVHEEMQRSLALCANVIIPTLFPFSVLSELLCGIGSEKARKKRRRARGLFYRLFGVPHAGMSAFVLGALCGFPIGIKHARSLYDNGTLDGVECARLLCFANNTGPAFVIAGVGGALFSSFSLGIWMYFIQLISALSVGGIFARLPCACITAERKASEKSAQNLASAIGKSTITILCVCGIIVFFSGVCAVLSVFCKNSDLLQFIYPFLEISGACSQAANAYARCGALSVFATMFAISFGGAAVHMQALLFFEDGGFPLLRYLSAKCLQALFSCLLLAALLPLIQ